MKTNPISFKSLLVFTLRDGRPKAPIPDLVKAAFKNNPILKDYHVEHDVLVHKGETDGTLYNANSDFCQLLDKKYSPLLPKGSRKVLITEADFYINATDKEKRYFVTAATAEDENKIHKQLGKSNAFYAARFKPKQD